MRRTGKQGLGTAYLAGFRWGLDRGYDVLVEMDADGSHRPEQLPLLLARTAEADLVVGSRWVRGGRVVNWPRNREILSRGANIYTRLAMGVPLRDATAGFRAYRAAMLDKLDLSSVASHGYCFQIDMSWRVDEAGGRIVEVPITFVERTVGESKMSRGIVFEALSRVTIWGVQRRAAQLGRLLRPRKN
jgi:dolichol-phosphate mannosyltransferase